MAGETTSRGRPSMSRGGSRRSRSKSRERRNAKPLGARLKGMMKGIRKSSRNIGKQSSSRTDSESKASIQIEKKDFPSMPSEVAATPPEAAPAKEEEKTFNSLQLVLLLMDPSSRRFELLQLEFDSEKARVSDIIAQIPISVTEPAIRQQSFQCVLDESATMRDQQTRLLDFCGGRQVLVAVPTGTSVKECVRLARPILSDPQVVKMLNLSGFNVNKWEKSTETKEAEIKTRAAPAATETPAKPAAAKKAGPAKVFAPWIPIVALLVLILQTFHNHITQPIQVGVPLPPGTWRSKCGMLAYWPFDTCLDAHMEVNADGTVAVFNELNELDMLLVGGICTSDNCVDGILLEEDGRVYIGGRVVKSAARFDDENDLSPWPFEKEPRLKANPFSKVNAAASTM